MLGDDMLLSLTLHIIFFTPNRGMNVNSVGSYTEKSLIHGFPCKKYSVLTLGSNSVATRNLPDW